jgi:cellulose synthase operon protein C
MTCSSNTTCTPERTSRTGASLTAAVLAVLTMLALPTGAGEARATGSSGELARYRTLAAEQLAEGDIAKAGAALNRALAIAPLDSGLWVDIARFRYVGGEHVLAIAAAERALAFGPRNPAALRLKAELVRDSDGPEPALAWFAKALERAPGDLSLKAEYAATLGDAGRAAEMLALTREILDSDPGNARAFYLQAVLAARARNFPLAKRLLDRTGDRLGNLPGAMLLRGIVEIDAQNHTLAIAALEPLLKRQPDNARARDLLARAVFLSGDYTQLVERFGEDAVRDDASPYLTMTVARAFEQLDRRDRAAPLLDKVAKAASRAVVPVGSHDPVGRMLASGDIGGARALVGGWLAANPGNFDHLALAGDVELVAGNGSAAIQYYDRASRIRNPHSLTTRRIQAKLIAGDAVGAARLAEARLAVSPASVPARRTVAFMAAASGDWARSRRLLESVALEGRSRDVQLLSDLALVQARTGDTALGLETARRASALYRAQPLAAQAMGVALVADGSDPEGAAALLAKARAIMGDNPLLVEARAVLAAGRTKT